MIDWILGLVMAVFAVLGVVLASGAYDTGMYTFGLLLFAFGVFFDFWLVKKSFDAKEQAASAEVAVPETRAAAE
jgi:hypothetical protein